MISIAFSRTSISVAALTGLLAFSPVGHAKDYLKGERPQQRGYSEAVITEGGRTVWLAGQTATVDDTGKYSVIPSTEVIFWTPCGKVWEKAALERASIAPTKVIRTL